MDLYQITQTCQIPIQSTTNHMILIKLDISLHRFRFWQPLIEFLWPMFSPLPATALSLLVDASHASNIDVLLESAFVSSPKSTNAVLLVGKDTGSKATDQ